MTEDEQRTAELLNELYAAQSRSLLPRLAEAHVFVSGACAEDLEHVRRMIAEEGEHRAWLAEAIGQAAGSVYPVWADPATGHLHYLALPALLPRVLGNMEQLARLYSEAPARCQGLLPEAADLITRITRRHREHLEQLRQIQQRMSAQPA